MLGKRSFATGTLVVMLSLMLVGLTAAPASAASFESSFFSQLNAERRARGLASLDQRSDLTSIARNHSTDMAARETIWHSDDLDSRVKGCWTWVSENVGVGPSVDEIHKALMRSPSHRDNILGRYNQVGVGVVLGPDDSVYLTQIFARRGECPAKTKNTKAPAKKIRPKKTTPAARTPRPSAPEAPTTPAAARTSQAAGGAPAEPRATTAPRTVDLLVRMLDFDVNG